MSIMAELTYEVKEFIEDNIDLIEDRAWDQIYDNAKFNLDSESTGGFTNAMLSIGIDPVKDSNLDYIPEYYLTDQSIDTYSIEDSVQSIEEGAFAYSKIKKIVIPESVTSIGSYAFYDCLKLEEVTILSKKLMVTGSHVFSHFPETLKFRCYENTPVASWLINEIGLLDEDCILEYII